MTGAMLCGLGFISAIVVGIMDVIGIRQLGDEENLKNESKKLVMSVYTSIVLQKSHTDV